MTKKIIATDQAPQAIGSYSQAVQAGGFLFASGQIALDPQTGDMVNDDFQTEARRVFDNVKGIAEAASLSLADVVKLTVYITDLSDFATLNEVMGEYFDEPYPARAAVQVAALPRGATVEVDATFLSN
ncbi:MAG: RidA family protein [Arenicella sp.]